MAIKEFVLSLMGAVPVEYMHEQCALAHDGGVATGYNQGFHAGKEQAKIKFAVLPLPFTAHEVSGRAYGEFITPAGFATEFGECTIPAPSVYGYENRAYYVSRDQLEMSDADLVCHRYTKFSNPADSSKLVPVIVTVLR